MRFCRLLCLAVFSCFSGSSYADLPYCENVFNGVLNTTGGKVDLWGSSKVIGSVDLNSTTISGGGANCYSSDGGAAYSCTANGTLSQVVSYTVPALPSIPPVAGAANGTLDRSSGSPALIVDSSGNYSGMNLNGYGSLVSVTFDGRTAPIVVNIAGSVGLGGNVKVNILGDVTIVANGYSSYGSPEVVVSQGASLALKSRDNIGFSNGLKLNMQGSSSSVNVYARNDFSLPNDTVMRGRVAAGGNIQLSGSASIVGPVSAAGNISMSSSSTIRGNVMLGGRLAISGNARIDGNLWAGSVHMSGGSKITGIAAVSGSFDGHGSSIFTGALVAGSVTLTGSAQAILSEGLDYTDFCRDDAVVEFDHLRLFHTGGGQAVSCMATEIRMLACANEDCTEVFPGPASFPLGLSSGRFTNHTVAIDESGQGRVFLSNPSGGLSTISSNVPLVCNFPGCSIDFKDSALFISNKANSLEDIPAQIAGKPFEAFLHAISTNPDTKACEARVEGRQSVDFSFSCIDPGSCVNGKEYSIGGDSILGARELKFVSGVSERMEMRYTDAGKVKVEASLSLPKDGDDPAVVLEGSAEFVSRPFGLCLETDLTHDSAKRFAGVAGGETVHVAGDAFELRVRAVAWTPADEADPDASAPLQPRICANPTTPNYQQAGISLTHAVLEPDPPANNGNLTIKSYVHQRGESTVVKGQEISEVGIFQLTAKPPAYFGHSMAHSESLSSRIGRFIPARLLVTGVGSLKSCDGVSYQGEPLEYEIVPSLTVTALNRAGEPAENYDRGNFWSLANRPSEQWLTQETGRDITSKLSLNRRPVENGVDDGDGARVFSSEKYDPDINWDLKYARSSSPGSEDLKFSLRNYYQKEVLTDQDGVCHRANEDADCDGYALDLSGGDIRLGRLQIGNAHGSELENLALPWRIQSWQSPGVFLAEAKDSCSSAGWSVPNLDDFTDELEGHTSLESAAVQGHQGVLVLLAPGRGHTGSATAGFPDLPDWFWYDWRGPESSRGLATFGIYEGAKPLIFRREVYR